MGHETYQKDSYNFTFGMIGGRKNKYNSPGHGKPSKPGKQGKPLLQGVTEHNNNNSYDDDDDDDDDDNHPGLSHPPQHEGIENVDHSGQSQPPQQGVFLPAPGAYACAYSTPYPYQCPPPPYPNQLAVGGYNGGYHVQGYPGSFVPVPHQGGYGGHGGGRRNDVGLVGAVIGVASFGMFKLLGERIRYGRRRR